MKQILILQNTLLHYRKSFFNELSKFYNVTVLHSGKNTVKNSDKYKEIIVNVRKIGPFFIQDYVIEEVKSNKYDIVISMFDLRWINNVLAMYLHNKSAKFIWWGAWLTKSNIANSIRIYLSNQEYSSIFYTKEAKNMFLNKGISKDKLFVANNTFDVGERIKAYENKSKFRILFVGSLDKRKENKILIEAFNKIYSSLNSSVVLTIIGDGEERLFLENLVSKLKLRNNVSFTGKITNMEILKEYYKESIISVSFGQAGLSVLQSLAYGVPFLTKVNAISGGEKTNIIDGLNGLFCEDSIESLTKILKNVCLDIDLARELGKNAYSYYSKYCTIENMVQGFKDAIDETRLSN